MKLLLIAAFVLGVSSILISKMALHAQGRTKMEQCERMKMALIWALSEKMPSNELGLFSSLEETYCLKVYAGE